MTLEEQIQKLTAERDAALKERDDAFATAKYFVEQNAIEVSKRGEAEHQVDLARGDLSEHISKLECDAMSARVERDAALKESAEARSNTEKALAELGDATRKRIKAEEACAEMRDAINEAWNAFDNNKRKHHTDPLTGKCILGCQACAVEKLKHCLSSDCGKGYVKAESLRCFRCDDGHTPLYCLNCAREGYHHDDEWKMVVEALEAVLPDAEDYPNSTVVKIKQAIAHAEKLRGGE